MTATAAALAFADAAPASPAAALDAAPAPRAATPPPAARRCLECHAVTSATGRPDPRYELRCDGCPRVVCRDCAADRLGAVRLLPGPSAASVRVLCRACGYGRP